MVHIEIQGNNLIVEMTGWDILWSCKKRIEVPLSSILDARIEHHPRFPGFALRMGGTALPGVIIAGNYLCNGKWYFWNIRHGTIAVVIDLQGQHYCKIVLEVPAPNKLVEELKTEIAPSALAV